MGGINPDHATNLGARRSDNMFRQIDAPRTAEPGPLEASCIRSNAGYHIGSTGARRSSHLGRNAACRVYCPMEAGHMHDPCGPWEYQCGA